MPSARLPLWLIDTRPRAVAPGFWLGGRDSRHSPPEGGWAVIVNCTAERYHPPQAATLIECAIEDGQGWDADALGRVYARVSAARQHRQGPILIHCSAGVSRSVAMATYLLTRLGVFRHPEEALAACRYSSLPFFGPKRRTYRSVLEALRAHRSD